MHEIIRPALEKYLNDNGAAPICKTHLDPLTDAIAEAIECGTFQLSGKVSIENGVANIAVQGKLASGSLKIQPSYKPISPFNEGDRVQIAIYPAELSE